MLFVSLWCNGKWSSKLRSHSYGYLAAVKLCRRTFQISWLCSVKVFFWHNLHPYVLCSEILIINAQIEFTKLCDRCLHVIILVCSSDHDLEDIHNASVESGASRDKGNQHYCCCRSWVYRVIRLKICFLVNVTWGNSNERSIRLTWVFSIWRLLTDTFWCGHNEEAPFSILCL